MGPANSQYQLSISGFTGITSDPFEQITLNGMKFTTKDRDNDKRSSANCATSYGKAGTKIVPTYASTINTIVHIQYILITTIIFCLLLR